jgi:hypothetical protein
MTTLFFKLRASTSFALLLAVGLVLTGATTVSTAGNVRDHRGQTTKVIPAGNPHGGCSGWPLKCNDPIVRDHRHDPIVRDHRCPDKRHCR